MANTEPIKSMLTQPLALTGLPVSRVALGCMGLSGTWDPKQFDDEKRRRAIASFEAAMAVGITFYDHADIYGGGTCEAVFKDCLAAVPGSRERIFIATKAAIRFDSGSVHYDHSPAYLRESLRRSLDRLGVDYVDLYQLHRPDPLSHPAETAAVLDEFVAQGLVRTVGVSNYYPHQVAALRRYLRVPVVSNQIAFSLLHLDPLYEGAAGRPGSSGAGEGVLDQCIELGITVLAYSPIGGGWLSGRRTVPDDHPRGAVIARILAAMEELAPAYGGATPTQLALAWILAHPAKIIPLVGSNDPAHIHEAAGAAHIALSRTDWYKLWVAARGEGVP